MDTMGKTLERSPNSTRRRLSPDELCEIAERMVAATDAAEIATLRAAFERGFYGDESEHA